ncbi:hypothetical protein CQ018_12600 [Arthrobacter sp. MYb227]|nr:hypothetical protein CQ018_12600 [Arthrobacter sp. MYb227]
MTDPDFRNSQEAELWAEHVAPINSLVEDLRAENPTSSVQFTAPLHGGTDARILVLLPAPESVNRPQDGSDILSTENDDANAEALATLLAEARIDSKEVILWNAFPWYLPSDETGMLKASRLNEGMEPASRFLRLVPTLRTVILMGKGPQDFWAKLSKKYPEALTRITAINDAAPAPLVSTGTKAQQASRLERRSAALREARNLVRPEHGRETLRRETMVRAEELGPEHLGRVVEVTDGNLTLHGPLLKAFQPSPEWRVTVTVSVANQRRSLGVTPDTWVRIYRGAGVR